MHIDNVFTVHSSWMERPKCKSWTNRHFLKPSLKTFKKQNEPKLRWIKSQIILPTLICPLELFSTILKLRVLDQHDCWSNYGEKEQMSTKSNSTWTIHNESNEWTGIRRKSISQKRSSHVAHASTILVSSSICVSSLFPQVTSHKTATKLCFKVTRKNAKIAALNIFLPNPSWS